MGQESTFNLLYLLDILKKYGIYIGGTVLLACILAVVFTMPYFYPPEFRASTVIYPTNPERFDLDNLFAEEPMIYLYGDSKGVERLDNIANSELLQLGVIETLNLWEVYGIDKDQGSSPKYYALRNFAGNVKTVRIAGNGLEIEAYDRDPERAAAIVNLMVERINTSYREMLSQNKTLIRDIYLAREKTLQKELVHITDSMRVIRSTYNIYDMERQSEALLKKLVDVQVQSASTGGQSQQRQIRALQEKSGGMPLNLETFREGYDLIMEMEWLHEEYTLELKNVRNKLTNLDIMSQVAFDTVLSTEKAQVPDRKSRPVRWVILAAAFLLSLFVSMAGLLLFDRLYPVLFKKA